MTAHLRSVTFDCRDPYLQAQFWSAVLGYVDDPDNPNRPDDPEALIVDPRALGPQLLFIPVPEPKTVKNRVHLDLRPDVGRDVMVERVEALGGKVIADHRNQDGSGWVVMADPEGNELCVERSAAERPEERLPVEVHRPWFTARTADERRVLEAMLDWYRDGVVAKVEGVRPWHAVARPLRSPTSIAGIVLHLTLVEEWFTVDFAGLPPDPDLAALAPKVGDEWERAADLSVDELLAGYRAACERSRAAAAGHDLDEPGANPLGDRPFTLRYVYVHMIEETARHLGHLDILRELLDGTTGE